MRAMLWSVVLSVLAAGVYADEQVKPGQIQVEVKNVELDRGGQLVISLFENDEHWLDMDKALAVKKIPVAEGEQFLVSFDGLAVNKNYAIQAHHDANDNGKADMRWFPFPKPKEGSGFSNNYAPSGIPEYEGAVITLEGESLTSVISIKYY